MGGAHSRLSPPRQPAEPPEPADRALGVSRSGLGGLWLVGGPPDRPRDLGPAGRGHVDGLAVDLEDHAGDPGLLGGGEDHLGDGQGLVGPDHLDRVGWKKSTVAMPPATVAFTWVVVPDRKLWRPKTDSAAVGPSSRAPRISLRVAGTGTFPGHGDHVLGGRHQEDGGRDGHRRAGRWGARWSG